MSTKTRLSTQDMVMYLAIKGGYDEEDYKRAFSLGTAGEQLITEYPYEFLKSLVMNIYAVPIRGDNWVKDLITKSKKPLMGKTTEEDGVLANLLKDYVHQTANLYIAGKLTHGDTYKIFREINSALYKWGESGSDLASTGKYKLLNTLVSHFDKGVQQAVSEKGIEDEGMLEDIRFTIARIRGRYFEPLLETFIPVPI